MKVVDIKTMVVENIPPHRGGKYLLFLEVVTDEGIVGLGERVTGNVFADNLAGLKAHISLIGRDWSPVRDRRKPLPHRENLAARLWLPARLPPSEPARHTGAQCD